MKVRKWLLQSYSLEAIISLPEDTFMYSGVRSGVMVFSKLLCPAVGKDIPREYCIIIWKKQEDKEKAAERI